MSKLTYELKGLLKRSRAGSASTRGHRKNRLMLIASQLKEGGFGLKSAFTLKPKHVTHLVERWQDEGLSIGTIKNRLGDLRWWADATGKPGMIPADNASLGIGTRSKTGNRAQPLDLAKVERLPCVKMQVALKLQAGFGLRVEESLYFRPKEADKGKYIQLKGNWTKGGRPRKIPITSKEQRQLLDEAKAIAGNGSMIPAEKTFIQGKKALENQTLKAGITNMHGHRYHYAQQEYKLLTGKPCPYQGGKPRKKLSPVEKKNDALARGIVSTVLGHNRIEVTSAYLG